MPEERQRERGFLKFSFSSSLISRKVWAFEPWEMTGRWFRWIAASLSVVLCLFPWSPVAAQNSNASPWQTLNGGVPIIIANGGFSGLFPSSSMYAYNFAYAAGSPNATMLCDVRLTKDAVGVCLQNLLLNNCTDIASIYPNGENDYLVNGVHTKGWFSVDFPLRNLSNISVTQGIYSRTDRFDYSKLSILTVEEVQQQVGPPSMWLNVQNDIFYSQHNLSMTKYILQITQSINTVEYISSPEVGFLTGIAATFQKSNTKLVFRFLGVDVTEPSTNQTYGTLLKNLTFIKTFASGILVPKQYIWPLTSNLYLEPHTSIVTDAHKEGLEIYAGDFANDVLIAYNYSFDPLAEYLSYIDNGEFSVDGVLTDFPVTPAEAIGCYSHLNESTFDHGKPVIFSHYGASGDYPDCTDLAYQKAVNDGTDFIDCPVQVTQDGVFICMSSINLMDDTNVVTSPFRSRISTIPELQSTPGIFTFNLTWNEIQTNLTPSISDPEISYNIVRNPLYKNAGKFMTLSDFLLFAKGKTLAGVLINIENAAFLAENVGISVIDGVFSALNNTGYSNQTTLEVIIQSSNSSVLVNIKQKANYTLMYRIDESIRDAVASSVTDIKKFADSVAVDKESIYPETQAFVVNETHLIKTLQNAGLSVYVYVLRNEFVSQDWDFFSDPHVQINSFVDGAGVDGIITDFPASARTYKRNSCRDMGNNTPNYMKPVQVGGLKQLIVAKAQPPALSPLPLLVESDVVEPPLPPVTPINASSPTSSPPKGSPPSDGPTLSPKSSVIIAMLMILGSLLFS